MTRKYLKSYEIKEMDAVGLLKVICAGSIHFSYKPTHKRRTEINRAMICLLKKTGIGYPKRITDEIINEAICGIPF